MAGEGRVARSAAPLKATDRRGHLPTFLVIGAARAGTTSLAAYLDAHPDVFIPPQKEVRFFDVHHRRGVGWYRDQFARARSERAIGEATPSYLYDAQAPARMAALLPDARLIAVLRNPIERAYSHYWFVRGQSGESREFADVVRDEMSVRQPADRVRKWPYLAMGRYVGQLQRVCEHYPRSALLILLFDDLRDDPRGAFAAVCRHIGVDDSFRPRNIGTVLNAPYRRRSTRLWWQMLRFRAWERLPLRIGHRLDELNKLTIEVPPMDPAVRRDLAAWYADDVAALGAWLDRDLSAWLH